MLTHICTPFDIFEWYKSCTNKADQEKVDFWGQGEVGVEGLDYIDIDYFL